MKTKHWIASVAIAAAIVFLTPRLISQDEGAGNLTPERLEELAARNQPGPEHALLAGLAGEWTSKSRYFMRPGEAMLSQGTASNELILEGRFLSSVSHSRGGPIVLEQLNLYGFDRRLEEYTLASFDTWGTQYLTAVGYMDEETQEITVSGQDFDPGLGTVAAFDVVLRVSGPDEYVLEFYEKPSSTDRVLKIETVYTRTK